MNNIFMNFDDNSEHCQLTRYMVLLHLKMLNLIGRSSFITPNVMMMTKVLKKIKGSQGAAELYCLYGILDQVFCAAIAFHRAVDVFKYWYSLSRCEYRCHKCFFFSNQVYHRQI
uniref:Uncharacterized protein n=1 Tax=Parascaris univalens TaxID=6257 RepID=A0A914ZJ69_PARUN